MHNEKISSINCGLDTVHKFNTTHDTFSESLQTAFLIIYISLGFYSPSRTRVYHPNAGLTSICPQVMMKDHLVSLGVMSGQQG